MTRRDLSRLLRPRSIAVFGGEWASNVIEQCRRMNYDGDIFAVNPKRDTLHGAPCFRRIADLPAAPDASFIGINRHAAVDAIAELSALGGGGAVCFASGFAETGEEQLQQQLLDAANDMPVLGPNCYGVINFLDGALLWPDQHGGARVASGVALIGQSSNILINVSSQKRGLPVAYVAAAGNQAQTTMADIALGMLDDSRVRAIGFYVEGIANAADFAAMAQTAEERGVPLVAVKSGKCQSSADAAASHTAALAGDSAASSAFLKRCNIAETDTIPEFLETLKLLSVHGKLGGRKIMSLSCSGGEAGHIADLSAAMPLQWEPPPPEQHQKLADTLGPLVRIANPLDYHTFIWRDKDALHATYSHALKCNNDLTMLIYDYPREDRCDLRDWQLPMESFIQAVTESKNKAAVVSTLPENMPEDIAAKLQESGIAPLCGLSEALTAFSLAAARGEHAGVGKWRPHAAVENYNATTTITMNEHDAKQFLSHRNIACPTGRRASSPENAQQAAMEMSRQQKHQTNFAVKQLGIAHKTESGGVKLNVPANDVQAAAKSMPAGDLLVEEMAQGGVAELLLCVRRAAVYGMTLTVGIGGVQAELLNDTQTLILPTTKDEIVRAIQQLRLFPLLSGYRGAPAADIDAAVETALQLAFLIESEKGIAEIEINPLILRTAGKGAVSADAFIRVSTENQL